MKRTGWMLCLLAFVSVQAVGQVVNRGGQMLAQEILQSQKKYKLIYVYSSYCPASIHTYPLVDSLVRTQKDVAFYPLSTEDSTRIEACLRARHSEGTVYRIDDGKKHRMSFFHNPINATCRYIERKFGVDTSRMGASDICLLDRENHLLFQSDWDMTPEEMIRLLKECLAD